MFTFLGFVQFLAYFAVIGIAGAVGWSKLAEHRRQQQPTTRKRAVGSVSTWQDEGDRNDPLEAAKASLKFLGLPSIHGGRPILNVPAFDPVQEGWEQRRTVVTAARITAQMRQGPVPGDLVELDGNYALLGVNGNTFLLQAHTLTTAEEDNLEKQRQDAVEKGDGVVENFQGTRWKISMACGSHSNPRPGEKSTSTIQVLSTHPGLKTGVVHSCLPPNLLDGAEHSYFDMRAKSLDGEERRLLFFYAGGTWSCFMGRQLTDQERERLQAL